MRLQDFDYSLPEDLIAQQPATDRSASRLLHVDAGGGLHDGAVRDLPALLAPGDLLVFNDTRVIKARLYGSKASGGRVELLIERLLDEHNALAQIRASHAPRPGGQILIGPDEVLEVMGRQGEFFHIRVAAPGTIAGVLECHGRLPLPPYITRDPAGADEARYQTVYARQPGAVAAPTAGLHFDQPLLDSLARRGVASAFVTLHVGAGTFQPVRSENLDEHRMHTEHYDVPAATVSAIERTRQAGGRVVAVGTTSLRALESAAADGGLRAGASQTALFIRPGYHFAVVDCLVTNFHLPKSTLLMLVSAFAGFNVIRAAYAHAVRQRYRFFSYGDAMLLERRKEP